MLGVYEVPLMSVKMSSNILELALLISNISVGYRHSEE